MVVSVVDVEVLRELDAVEGFVGSEKVLFRELDAVEGLVGNKNVLSKELKAVDKEL